MRCPKCGSGLRIIHTDKISESLTCRTYACRNLSACNFRKASYDDLADYSMPLDRILEQIRNVAKEASGKSIAERLEALAEEIRGMN